MTPDRRYRFTFALVGTAEFTRDCGELLRAAGHELTAVASASPTVRDWAGRAGVASTAEVAALARSDAPAFDYLFSVVNGIVLGPCLLAAARRGAINYHNGPLPRYAGVHAASWAVLNGEREHGVTWHRMVERIDAGPVLARRVFPLVPGTTAGEINDTCRRLGLDALAAVADALASGQAHEEPQDLSRRTYHSAHRRDPSGGLLRWDAGAVAVSRTVRAGDVGRVRNTFGSARLDLGDRSLLVGRVDVRDGPCTAEPGTVTGVDDDRLTVATSSSAVEIGGLRDHAGAPVRPDTIRIGGDPARPGMRLPIVSRELARRLRTRLEEIAPDEDRCAHALAEAVSSPLPATGADHDRRCVDRRTGGRFVRIPETVREELVVAATAIAVATVTAATPVSVRCHRPDGVDGLARFVGRGLPVTVSVGPRDDPPAVLARVRDTLVRRGHDGFPLDVVVRRGLPAGEPPVAAGVADAHGAPQRCDQLRVTLDPRWLHLCSTATPHRRALSAAELDRMAELVGEALRRCGPPP